MDFQRRREGGLMKKLLSILAEALLISAAALCAIGAVSTSFSLVVDFAVLLKLLIPASLAVSAAFTMLRAYGLFVCIPVYAALLYFGRAAVLSGGKAVLNIITHELSVWMQIPVLFSGIDAAAQGLTLFFAAFGALLVLLLGISICLRRSVLLTILFTLPTAALSLIIESMPPKPLPVLGLLAVYSTLIFSTALRPEGILRRIEAVLPALVMTAVLMSAAFLTAGTDGHERSDFVRSLDNRISSFVMQLDKQGSSPGIGWPSASGGGWSFDTYNVEIANAGTRTLTGESLLEVRADKTGTYYLSGYSMTRFDGRAWNRSATSFEAERGNVPSVLPHALITEHYAQLDSTPPETVLNVIRTGDNSSLAYMPYFSPGYIWIDNNNYSVEFIDETEKILGYGLYDLEKKWGINHYVEQMMDYYLEVDEETADILRGLAQKKGISPDSDRAVIADSVAKYISSAARYTLSPPVTPEDENFTEYFLTQSRRGYCIHFATAATLMLRALDVPARFTSGFVVTVPEAGEYVEVTDLEAHAWVEVYYDNIGWIPLEVTPSTSVSVLPAGFEHAAYRNDDAFQPPSETGQVDETAPPEVTAASQPTNAPPEGTEKPEPDEKPEPRIPAAIYVIAVCVLTATALVLRRKIILLRRKKAFNGADINASVCAMWRYITRLCGKNQRPPAQIEELALKARFSQHTLTETERKAVRSYSEELLSGMRTESGGWHKFRQKYILALW